MVFNDTIYDTIFIWHNCTRYIITIHYDTTIISSYEIGHCRRVYNSCVWDISG